MSLQRSNDHKYFSSTNKRKLPIFSLAVNISVSLVASEFFTYTKCGLILQICVSINNKYSAEQDTEYL